jgi:hypothetical protein
MSYLFYSLFSRPRRPYRRAALQLGEAPSRLYIFQWWHHAVTDRELDLRENIEVIGEREIMIDVLLLPEMSRAERAGRAKKMNNSHCPALRRRRRGEAAPWGEAASWLHWKGKVLSIVCFLLYPASCVSKSGHGPAGLGKPKLLLTGIT